jgi:hypothetical protein
VTNARFAALSINSTDINATMAFLLNRTPSAPIEKIIPDKTK